MELLEVVSADMDEMLKIPVVGIPVFFSKYPDGSIKIYPDDDGTTEGTAMTRPEERMRMQQILGNTPDSQEDLDLVDKLISGERQFGLKWLWEERQRLVTPPRS